MGRWKKRTWVHVCRLHLPHWGTGKKLRPYAGKRGKRRTVRGMWAVALVLAVAVGAWQMLPGGWSMALLAQGMVDTRTALRLARQESPLTLPQVLMEELPVAQPWADQLVFLHTDVGESGGAEDLPEPSQQEQQTEQAAQPSESQPVPEGYLPVKDRTTASDSGQVQGSGVTMNNVTDFNVDIDSLMSQPLAFTYQPGKIQVLIVHTHTTESYLPDDSGSYAPDTSFRSFEEAETVVAVGEVLARQLTDAGIGVIHDRTVHDYPSYNGSYDNCKATIQKNLEQYPDICMVLDIHRDAIIAQDGTVYKTVTEYEGQKYAQVMMVQGSSGGGLQHDHWQDNLNMALHLQQALADVPNLARPVSLKNERYNQQLTRNSLLLEFGTCGNTVEEAKRSAEVVGKALARVLLACV